MTALQTLRGVNDQLETTQNRISTGKSVSTAQDNAAYWSIATTMTSDTSTLGAVGTSLGLAKSQADTAANGVNSLVSLLKDYRDRLASAAQPGMDKEKIRTELDQLKNQMTTIVSSSSTNGVNWLNGTGLASTTDNFDIISGLTRTGGSTGTTFSSISVSYKIAPTVSGGGGGGGGVATKASVEGTAFAASDLATAVSFSISDGTNTANITLDGTTTGIADSTAPTGSELATAITAQLGSVGATVTFDGTKFKIESTATGSAATITTSGAGLARLGLTADTQNGADAAGATSTVSNLISGVTTALASATTKTAIEGELTKVDNVLADLTKLGSIFGAASTRIRLQTEFTKNLTDTLQRGIGALVDADLDTESTKLKALQTQQQLAVQALSIANSNTQTILSLFRN